MRAIRTALLSAAMIASAAALGAQTQTSSNFASLEWLVGSCWTGPFPDGKAVDEHCFEWVYDKKFIRDRHVVRGGAAEYAGETLYAWDATQKRVTFTYWSSDGSVSTGSMRESPEGLTFLQSFPTPKGPMEIQAVWKRAGADGYSTTVAQRDGATWKPMWSVPFSRKR